MEPRVGRVGEGVFNAADGEVAAAVVVEVAFEGPLGAGCVVVLDVEIGAAAA